MSRPGGRTERVLYANPSHFGRGHVPVRGTCPRSSVPGISGSGDCIRSGSARASGTPRKEAQMFQDALFVPGQGPAGEGRGPAFGRAPPRGRAGLPDHGAAPTGGDLPTVDVSGIIVVPALPSNPLPPPKARAGNPGARVKARRAPVVAADPWRVAPVAIPDGIVEEAGFGADGMPGGIDGGVDYGVDAVPSVRPRRFWRSTRSSANRSSPSSGPRAMSSRRAWSSASNRSTPRSPGKPGSRGPSSSRRRPMSSAA